MEGKRLIKSLRLKNLLSYGSNQPALLRESSSAIYQALRSREDTGEEITLEPLNVLIGSNASGKSNLIEAISLLRATPKDLAVPIREGGGIREWLWKGAQTTPVAEVEAVVDYPEGIVPLRYRVAFTMVGQRLEITGESIESEPADADQESDACFYRYHRLSRQVRSRNQSRGQKPGSIAGRAWQLLGLADFSQEQSILSQLRDPAHYPELTYLGNVFGEIELFRETYFGPDALARGPQDTFLPDDFLLENASNLALVLNDFQHKIIPKQQILEKLKRFYSAVEDITTKIQGGTVQLFIHEEGLSQPIPAVRLSDGTLRYLCLLTLLCHPTPPPLLCIEEPELGLHPDVIPTIAELLIEASQRTQIIVTTHSDVLVSALSEVPESVLVCERDDEGTHLHRLEPARLTEWLEKYSLGELWQMGEIGGNRW